MKICPICKARCFDDMDICYGCMYHFESLESEIQKVIEAPSLVINNGEEANIATNVGEGGNAIERYGSSINLTTDNGVVSHYRLTICIEPEMREESMPTVG